FINAEEIDADGKVDVTVGLPADAVAGDTLTVNGEDTVLSAEDIIAGEVVVKVDAAAEGEALEVVVTLTDAAGNPSSAVTGTAIVDTTAPSAPTVAIGNGDGFINAEEIDADGKVDVTVGLPADAVAGDTLTVNGEDTVLSAEDIIAGEVVVKVDTAAEGEALEVVVTLTDAAGNVSATIDVEAVVDTIAPVVTIDAGSLTTEDSTPALNGTIDDPTATIKLTVNGVDYTAQNNGDGTWTLANDMLPILANGGHQVIVTATDTAGNVGIVTETLIINADLIIAAADNDVQAVLNVTPLTIENDTPAALNKTGFSLVSVGLGPVLAADVLENVIESSAQVTVEEGTTREVTFYADAGGIFVGTMDLYVYKLNETTGEWEQQEFVENWYGGFLGAQSEERTYVLDDGNWIFALANGEGLAVATGYTLRFTADTVYDYTQATNVSGTTLGNVITDDDVSHGSDYVPQGSSIINVSYDGVDYAVDSDVGATITTPHGVLTISANGDYSYEVNEDFREFGSVDSFTYTVMSPEGNTSTAQLNIELNIVSDIDSVQIDNTVIVTAEPATIIDTANSQIENAVGFKVLELGLLDPILSADALGGNGVMSFSVGENQVRELTLHGSAGGITIAATYDLYVYKLDEATNNYVQVHFEDNWFSAVLFAGVSDPLTLSFGEGDYRAILVSNAAVAVASGAGLYVDHDKVVDYNTPTTFEGSISGDATEDTIVKVNGEDVVENEETTVLGSYGTLTIQANGTYTYTLTVPQDTTGWTPPYGEVDRFNLVTQDAEGKASVDVLNIRIATHQAIDDSNAVQVVQSNLITTDIAKVDINEAAAIGNKVVTSETSGVIPVTTYTAEITNTYSITETFTVNENAVANGTLKIVAALNGALLNNDDWGNLISSYQILDADNNPVISGELVRKNNGILADDTFEVTANIINLVAGEYRVIINVVNETTATSTIIDTTPDNNGEFTVSTDITVKETLLNAFKVDSTPNVTGNLLGNDGDTSLIDTLSVGRYELYVNDANKGADSVSINGLYGVLILEKDGSYTYTGNGVGFGIETFTYTTTSVTGTKETATLEINVGKTVSASLYADSVESSAGNDTFSMAAGADSLIYTLLNANDATGGNGTDIWTDFHVGNVSSDNEADKINISALLDGNQTSANIDEYITVSESDDGKAVINIDRDGANSVHQSAELLKLDNVSYSTDLLQTLLENNQIIF
ncbi:BapA/Bap/LapF family large adhesin, partial [Acinetobacter populi]